MKEHGLLCTASVALALHEGRQWQDRRPMKPQPTHSLVSQSEGYPGSWYGHGECNGKSEVWKCPVQVGDIFCIREPYYAYGRWVTRFNAKKGRDEWHFEDMTFECCRVYVYSAKGSAQYTEASALMGITGQVGWYKRPARFMPQIAARTRKRVTGIRVEHGPEISDDDAKAGGIYARGAIGDDPACSTWTWSRDAYRYDRPSEAFRALWHDLYGDDKPWRWVYELENVGK